MGTLPAVAPFRRPFEAADPVPTFTTAAGSAGGVPAQGQTGSSITNHCDGSRRR